MWLWFWIWTKIFADRRIWQKKAWIGGFAYPCSPPSSSISWFRSIIGRADFARLAFVLLLAPLAIEEDCLAEAISSELLPVTGSRVQVTRIWIKTPLIFLVCIEITVKNVRSGDGGGELPYMGHTGMCRCEGYGFQAVYSRIGYINQSASVWV